MKQNLRFSPVAKLMMVLLALGFYGQGMGQTWLYFQDSPDPDSYSYSWMEEYPPSLLERMGSEGLRFPVESVIPAWQGMNSLRLHWTSNTGGNWFAIAAGLNWTAKDISTGDTLSFYLRSETALSADLLPKVFFEDTYNTKSTFIPITPHASDLQPGVWTRVKIPMGLFFTAGDPVDYTVIKTVGYTQNMADGIDHTIYVDDVRVYKGGGISPPVSPPTGLTAKGYENHVFLTWAPNPETNVSSYEIYRSSDGGQTFARVGVAPVELCMFTDHVKSISHSVEIRYYLTALNMDNQPSGPSDTVGVFTRSLTDDELLEMVQEATFRYFYDYAHPVSGMARERYGSGNTVTTGGSGFGVMAILVGVHRGFITRQQGIERITRILDFLQDADRFHGAWPHWLNGNTGAVIPFGETDNGGDLVETAFMIQGLLAARTFFDQQTTEEQQIRNVITQLWEEVEWDWYRKSGSNVLYWHWSPTYGWAINMQVRGYNEAMIVYLLAIASPTHPVPASLWNTGWAGSSYYLNGRVFYNHKIWVGWDYGGPLFFTHYSFLGFDPRNIKDDYANYFENSKNISLIHHDYSIDNPLNHTGYTASCWGLTASDDPDGYTVHEPTPYRDNGTITPSAALSAMPYTPAESMAALKHFYNDRGDRLWGNFGFIDAFNLERSWYATSYLAIDQGPIVGMIENYRSGLLWGRFMANAEIQPALDAIGFVPDSASHAPGHALGAQLSCFPNPVQEMLYVSNPGDVTRAVITNMFGQPAGIFENFDLDQIQLPVGTLPDGLYNLTLYYGNRTASVKFIKNTSY